MQLYRGIIKRAFDITWRSKYLWFFGLFAALLGNGGEYEILFKPFSVDVNSSYVAAFAKLTETGIFSAQGMRGLGDLLITQPLAVIVAILTLVILASMFFFVIWLVNVSQAVLVKNTLLKISDKRLSFKDSLSGGVKKFWPVFGFNMISRVFAILTLSLVGYTVLWSSGLGAAISGFVYIIVFLLFIPVAMSFSFIVKYSIGFSVIDDVKFLDAFSSGWKLFKKNWLISLEMAFVLYFVNIAVALIFVALALVIAVPFALLAFAMKSLAMAGMFLFIIVVGVILLLSFLIATGSFVAIFQISSWTLLFIELNSGGGKSKLIRMFTR